MHGSMGHCRWNRFGSLHLPVLFGDEFTQYAMAAGTHSKTVPMVCVRQRPTYVYPHKCGRSIRLLMPKQVNTWARS